MNILLMFLPIFAAVFGQHNNLTSPLRQARIFGQTLDGSQQSYPNENQDPYASLLPDDLRSQASFTVDDDEQLSASGLNSDRQARIESGIISDRKPYVMSVSCADTGMDVQVTFYQPFGGIIYSKGYFNKPDCLYVRGTHRPGTYKFTIDYDKCGSFSRKSDAYVDPPTRAPTTPTTPTTTSTTTEATTTTTEAIFTNWREFLSAGAPTTPLPPVVPQMPINQQSNPVYYNNGYPAGVQNVLPTSLQQQQPLYRVPLQQQQNPYQPNYLIPQQQNNNGMLLNNGMYSPNLGNNMYGNPYGRLGRSMDGDEESVDLRWVENTIIIQQDPNVQDALDEAKSLQCEWTERFNKKLVSSQYHVDTADVVRAAFPNNPDPAIANQVKVGAYMQIRSGLGPLTPETRNVIKIGNPQTLIIALSDSNNQFDLLVHSCLARGGGSSPPLQLVDANGCVLQPKHIGPFMPFYDRASVYGNNRVAFAFFQAFKFPDSTEVSVECAVTICRDACTKQCFGKYLADGKNYTKIFGGDEIYRRADVIYGPKDQKGIIAALERKLTEVNGPQKFDITVKSVAPVKVAGLPGRFLQLREMEDLVVNSTDVPLVTSTPTFPENSTEFFLTTNSSSTTTTILPKNSTQNPVDILLKKMGKRDVGSQVLSSDVGLSKKMTVIYPNEVEGMESNNNFANKIADVDFFPKSSSAMPKVVDIPARSMFDFPPQFIPTVPSTEKISTMKLVANSTEKISSLNSTEFSTVPSEIVTQPPRFFVMDSEQKHVCMPMMMLILGGSLAGAIILLSILCSACVCFKVNRQRRKAKQTFSIYSEPKSPAVHIPRAHFTHM